MPKVTVSDASCLILFAKIGELELLRKVYGNILITNSVAKEFNRPVPKWIKIINPKAKSHAELYSLLDMGEASSIALATEYSDSLLIVDETKGRKIARELGLRITGSLGVLVTAKNLGYLQSIKSILKKIEQTNFRISKTLIHKILQTANEI